MAGIHYDVLSRISFVFTLLCILFVIYVKCESEFDTGKSVGGFFKMEGKVTPPDNEPSDWYTTTRILVDGGQYLGFLREDGSFVVSNLPSGSYVVEVANPNYICESARVDINSKGKIRARRVNLIEPGSNQHLSYPLKFKIKSRFKYFQTREQWRITDFLFSPMVLMMVLPLLLIMVMPRLMNADPETQREMQQSFQSQNFEMPDIAETMTSLFGGKKPAPKSQKAIKKRQ